MRLNLAVTDLAHGHGHLSGDDLRLAVGNRLDDGGDDHLCPDDLAVWDLSRTGTPGAGTRVRGS